MRSAIELWLALAGPDWAEAVHARDSAAESDDAKQGGARKERNGRQTAAGGSEHFVWLTAPPDLRRPADAGARLAVALQALGDRAAATAVATRLLERLAAKTAGETSTDAARPSNATRGTRPWVR